MGSTLSSQHEVIRLNKTGLLLGGSSSRDKLLKNRETYINMCDQKQEELLQRNRDYKRHSKLIKAEPEETDVPTITQG